MTAIKGTTAGLQKNKIDHVTYKKIYLVYIIYLLRPSVNENLNVNNLIHSNRTKIRTENLYLRATCPEGTTYEDHLSDKTSPYSQI